MVPSLSKFERCQSSAPSRRLPLLAGWTTFNPNPNSNPNPFRLELVRGLRNHEGQYNCFLNVILQSLWHLRSFRAALLALSPAAVAARGAAATDLHVMQALLHVFKEMNTRPSSEQQQVRPGATQHCV